MAVISTEAARASKSSDRRDEVPAFLRATSKDLIRCATSLQQTVIDMEASVQNAPSGVVGPPASLVLQDMASCAQQAAHSVDAFVQKIVSDLRALEKFEQEELAMERVVQKDLLIMYSKCAKQAGYIKGLVQESAARQRQTKTDQLRQQAYEELLRGYMEFQQHKTEMSNRITQTQAHLKQMISDCHVKAQFRLDSTQQQQQEPQDQEQQQQELLTGASP